MIRSPGSLSLWHRLAAVAVISSSARSPVGAANRYSSCFVLTSCASLSLSASSAAAAFSSTARSMEEGGADRKNDKECQAVVTQQQQQQQQQQHPFLKIHHFTQDQPIASTQDEARRLLHEHSSLWSRDNEGPYLVAIADRQTNGRGTSGRKWESGTQVVGNLYLTVCIPFDKLPVMPTLLPLYVAVVVADRAQQALRKCHANLSASKVTVKWPNDVLINDRKLAGTLIESEIVDGTTWLLIGIGANIQFAPSLEQSPGKHVRGTTCILEHCAAAPATTTTTTTAVEPQQHHCDSAFQFGVDIAERLVDWILQSDTTTTRGMDKATREAQVISQWKSFAEFGRTYEMRGNVQDEDAGKHQGEEVVTVDIQYDGQLIVRGQDGQHRFLIADYMF